MRPTPTPCGACWGGGLADLLLTDPPYNVDYKGATADKLTIMNDSWGDEGSFAGFLADALASSLGVMRPGAAAYWWFAASHTAANYEAFACNGVQVRQELYWVKNSFVLGRQDYQWQAEACLYAWKPGGPHWFAPTRSERSVIDDCLDVSGMSRQQLVDLIRGYLEPDVETDVLREAKPLANDEHPTMKPVRLFARLIRNSTKPGETVLDVFGGSGTTAIACEQMGRRARLVELDPKYCDVILARWERLTGREAERVS